jgi:hypothetical protein
MEKWWFIQAYMRICGSSIPTRLPDHATLTPTPRRNSPRAGRKEDVMTEIDLTPEAVERLANVMSRPYGNPTGAEKADAAATLRALSARLAEVETERDAQEFRGDNHWETLRSIRHIAKTTGDLARIVQWVDDAAAGYNETAENTLAGEMVRRVAAEAELATARAEALKNPRVLRGGNTVIVDGIGYRLADLVAATFALVKDTDNPAFHMPGWFYSGSPYAEQIKRLGVSTCDIPPDFVPEYVPELGKLWRKMPTAWDAYTAALITKEQTNDH